MNNLAQALNTYTDTALQSPILLSLTILILLVLILIGFVIKLSRRVTRLMRGKHASSLEETMNTISKEISELHAWRTTANTLFEELDSRMSSSIRGSSLIRFNPFKGTGSGGNQSFSTALVNESGDGIVISSLYSRDRVSLFGKPLENFSSTFELTDEEKEAVTKAQKMLS